MYRSRKSPVIFNFFSWYISYILKKDFAAHSFNALSFADDEAVLLLANHFSWWDGFILFHLNQVAIKKQFHVLVNAEEYKKHWFLKYMGAFAAEHTGKDVIETLVYAGKLLDDPQNLVLVFPQGKAYPGPVRSVTFEKGIMQLVNASRKKFQFIFSVTLADHSMGRKPQMKTYLTKWDAEEYVSLQLLKSEYNKHYESAIRQQNKDV
ncbi:lysophospholipid acyltransferase family protein [Pedobacter metabolipauper]|uniref:Acyltransferase-like protein n=1 Tax=Pedobacter metabolipauper TaxID=425513 RepID=A0A4R6T080_9SPHI|nr:lysophospholipid acyltransferase family protein [Pedobacter metabolipauper]TDQ10364.1 acyltransferase-like protein [Pedobacter metabolipauper]